MSNMRAFKRILDLTSNCGGPDWTDQLHSFKTLLQFILSNCSKHVQNINHMAFKGFFFFQKVAKIAHQDPYYGALFSRTQFSR